MEQFKRVFLPFLLVALVACSWLNPLDSLATKQVDAGLKRALGSFATARALNAVISVAQGTQIAIEPAGIGVNLAPGQVLDPVNDLVEQFSHLMLVASVSFGVQRVLISVGGHWLVSAALTAVVLLWSLLHFRKQAVPLWLSKVLVVVIVLRLAVPLVTVGTDVIFQNFLAADYATSQKIIEAGAADAKKLNPPVSISPEPQGMLEKMKGWMPQNANIGARIDGYVQAAEQWPEQLIRLTVVFFLQTLLIPLALLWGLLAFAKCILRIHPSGIQNPIKTLPSNSLPES